jgi:hypothetical protein
MKQQRKRRVLIVIAHFDEMRRHKGRPNFFPQGVGHVYLAGAFNRGRTDIRLYSEIYSGPLEDLDLLAWPDMVVFTGVTASFDRMRHIAAYVRLLSPRAFLVVGGPVARNLPDLCAEFFDVVSQGDIEDLQRIADECFGPGHASEEMRVPFDLLGWKSAINYVESSRYCNFKCSFCSLTGEGRKFRAYAPEYIEDQIRAQPRGRYLLFIDNNFYGGSRAAYRAKIALLRRLRREGLFKGWIALVTNDFFADASNVLDAKSAGCVGLFSGLETLDENQLAKYGKRQNIAVPQLAAIEMCLEAGIVYQYGLMFDPASEPVSRMREQLDFIVSHDRIPMPAFMSLTIPLLGTPEFYRCLDEGRLLPNLRLRDMDGVNVVTTPLDPVPEVIDFVRDINDLRWARRQLIARHARFFWRYRRSLSGAQMSTLLLSGLRALMPGLDQNDLALVPRRMRAEVVTHYAPFQPLGRLYEPLIDLPNRLRTHFEPTMVTDGSGGLHPAMPLAHGRSPENGPSSVGKRALLARQAAEA